MALNFLNSGIFSGDVQLSGTTPTLSFFKTSAGDILANIKVESGVGTGGKLTIQTKRNGNTPIDALVIDNDQNATFAGNITALTGAGSGNITVGRNGNEKTIIDVGDQVNSITAYQDSDGNATHNFTLNRIFGGTGANDFIIQKDGTAQLTLDTLGNATFAGDLTVSGGDITLGGTGRIQGVDTVSSNTDAANKLYVDNAIAGVPQGDITGVTAGTFLTGGGTSGTVTLNADISKLGHIVNSSNGSVTAGWITVASASSARRQGEVYVTDGESGDHAFIRIDWLRSYADTNFTVLNCGGHSNRIVGVRVLQETSDATYGPKYLQVKVTVTSNYYVAVVAPGTIPNYTDLLAVTPVLENTKTGYAVTGAQLEDLDDSSVGTHEGLTVGEDLYVNGGGIVLGGTGRIQGVDTVSASTDAANKAYVDAHGGGLGPFLPLTAGSTKPLTGDLYIDKVGPGILLKDGAQDVAWLGDFGGGTDGQLVLFDNAGASQVVLNGQANSYFNGGNVGIGTPSPSAKLEVNGALFVGDHTGTVTPTDGIWIEGADGDETQIQMYSLNGSVFRVKNAATKATIGYGSGGDRSVNFTNSGAGDISVGIGTTSPENLLHVQQTGVYTGSHTTAGIRIKSDGASSVGNYHGTIALSRGTGSVAISAVQEATDSDVMGMAFFTHPSTTGGNVSVEQMRINAQGVVSITNGTPTFVLQNSDSSLISNQTIGDINFSQSDPSGGGVGVVSKIRSINLSSFQGEAGLAFHTGTATTLAERMRIDSAGAIKFNAYGAGTLVTDASGNITVSSGGGAGGPYLPLTGGTMTGAISMNNQIFATAGNYGRGVFGLYSPTSYQHVWSMGNAYKLADAGTSTGLGGNLYGLAWSYNPDYGAAGNNAQSKAGLNHQLLLMQNGSTAFAAGSGMWTSGTITANNGQIVLNGTGRIQGVDTVSASTDAANKAYVDNNAAPYVTFTRSGINSSTYTMIATVNGDRLASIIKMTMTGTSGSVVFASTFDITVNHSEDIHVKSMSGDYTVVTLRITSNNNEDYSIEAKHNGGSTTTAEVCIFPLAGEAITPTTTDPGYTGAEYEHTATEGWRFGGEDSNVESSNVIIDGKVGIGTTSPGAKLEVFGTGNSFRLDSAANGSKEILFRNVGTGTATIKTDGDLKLYVEDAGKNILFDTTGGEKMRILASGNVGIGTTNPFALLTLKRDSGIGFEQTITTNPDTRRWWVQNDVVEYGDFLIRTASAKDASTPDLTRLYINSAGNVGIGTTNPTNPLDVSNAASTSIVYQRTGVSANKWGFHSDNDATYWQNVTSGNMLFTLKNGGNVGIGTTNPTSALGSTKVLDISSTGNGEVILDHTDAGTASDLGLYSWARNNDHLAHIKATCEGSTTAAFISFHAQPSGGSFANAAANEKMRISSSGNVTIQGTTTATNFILSSDKRLKENIEEVCDNRIKADWKTFELKTEKGQKRYGVIAQELEKTNPEFVREDTQGFKSVAYIDLLIAKIAELEARLEKAGI